MRRVAKLFAGPGMIAAGLNHFVMPKTYEAIMPQYLPAHRELVYASGAAELLAAAATLHPATRRAGGWGLVATLIAIFPANLEMALHPERYRAVPPAVLWGRLPLQLGMLYLVWLAAIRTDASRR